MVFRKLDHDNFVLVLFARNCLRIRTFLTFPPSSL